MKALLLKEWYILIGSNRGLLFFFAIMTLAMSFSSWPIIYVCLSGSQIVIASMEIDEREQWDVYAATMPYSRAQIVSSKYILGIVTSMISCFIILPFFMIEQKIGPILPLCILALGLTLFPCMVVLPLTFRYGVTKARILYIIWIVVIVCVTTSIIMEFDMSSKRFLPVALSGDAAWYGLGLLIIVAYIISWRCSIHIYQNKDIG